MSSFKQLSKADVTSVSYAANKQWNLSFFCYPTASEYLNIYKGTNITGSFSPSEPTSNGQYERLIYSSINHLFYQEYSGSLNTGSLMFDINTYQSASQQRPTASYFDYNTNPLLIKNFPTGANESIRVLVINQDIYGSKVLPNSFALTSSAYSVTDDGNGNLYDTGSINGYAHIGNIFYAFGIGVITNQDYQLMFPTSSAACGPTTTTTTSTTTTTTTVPTTTTTSTTTTTTTIPTTTTTTTTTSTTTTTTTSPTTTTTSTTTTTTTAPTTTTTTTTTSTTTTTTTTAYYVYGGTTSTYATSGSACANQTCGRDYYLAQPSWAPGYTVYNDSALTSTFNGGSNWIAVATSVGSYCSGGWSAIQVNSSGVILDVVGC